MSCCKCRESLDNQDFAPAVDFLTDLPVCDPCVRKQRHARANPTFEIRMAEVDNREEWQ